MKRYYIQILAITLLFFTGCGEDDEDSTTPITPGQNSVVIGSSGGNINSDDGVVNLTIPAGSLSSDRTFTIEETTTHPADNATKVYDISPDGVQFDQPALMSFNYDESALPAGTNENNLAVAYEVENRWMVLPSIVNPSSNTVSAETSHLSTWTTVDLIPDGEPPVLDVGPLVRSANLNETVVIDGSGSSDPEGGNLEFVWALQIAPTGSEAVIFNPTSNTITFQPDVEGDYYITVTVKDEQGNRSGLIILINAGEFQELETVLLSGFINSDSTLIDRITDQSMPDYVVTEDLFVNANLVIEPGVVIEFAENTVMRIFDPGNLIANGLLERKIIFRGTSKAKGHWQGINIVNRFDNPAQISHCIIEHAGAPMDVAGIFGPELVQGSIVLGAIGWNNFEQPALEISNSLIRESAGYGIRPYKNGYFKMEDMIITTCDSYPVSLTPFNFGNINGDNQLTGNGRDRIQVLGGIISKETTVPDAGMTYEVGTPEDFVFNDDASSRTNVQAYRPLTIEAGVKMEFIVNSGLIVVKDGEGGSRSFLKVLGTEEKPVFMRSSADHYWQGISVESTNEETLIDNLVMSDVFHAINLGSPGVNSYLKMINSDIVNDGCGVRILSGDPTLILEGVEFDGPGDEICE